MYKEFISNTYQKNPTSSCFILKYQNKKKTWKPVNMCHNIGNNISPVSKRSEETLWNFRDSNWFTSELNITYFHLNKHFNVLYKQKWCCIKIIVINIFKKYFCYGISGFTSIANLKLIISCWTPSIGLFKSYKGNGGHTRVLVVL